MTVLCESCGTLHQLDEAQRARLSVGLHCEHCGQRLRERRVSQLTPIYTLAPPRARFLSTPEGTATSDQTPVSLPGEPRLPAPKAPPIDVDPSEWSITDDDLGRVDAAFAARLAAAPPPPPPKGTLHGKPALLEPQKAQTLRVPLGARKPSRPPRPLPAPAKVPAKVPGTSQETRVPGPVETPAKRPTAPTATGPGKPPPPPPRPHRGPTVGRPVITPIRPEPMSLRGAARPTAQISPLADILSRNAAAAAARPAPPEPEPEPVAPPDAPVLEAALPAAPAQAAQAPEAPLPPPASQPVAITAPPHAVTMAHRTISPDRPPPPEPSPAPLPAPPVTRDEPSTKIELSADFNRELLDGADLTGPAPPLGDVPTAEVRAPVEPPLPFHVAPTPVTLPSAALPSAPVPVAPAETPTLARRPKRRLARAFLVGAGAAVLLGAAGLVALRVRRPPERSAQTAGRAARAYDEGRRLLLLDSEDDFQIAHDLFLRAAGADEADPRPLAALAELHALWAGSLRKGAAPGAGPGPGEEATRQLRLAQTYAAQATALSATSHEANLAAALVLIEGGGAAGEVRRHLDQTAGRAEAAYARALLAVREGHPEEARAALREGKGEPPPLRGLVLLAELEAQAGRPEEARRLLQQAVARNPGHRRARQALAALAAPSPATLATSAPAPATPPDPAPAALAESSPAAPAEPVKPPPAANPRERPRSYRERLGQARRLLEERKLKDAQRIYEQLLGAHGEDPEVHAGLGACALKGERFQAASQHYRNALSLRADYPPAVLGLAETFRRRGDLPQALEYYRAYLKTGSGPGVKLARNNIARLESLLGSGP